VRAAIEVNGVVTSQPYHPHGKTSPVALATAAIVAEGGVKLEVVDVAMVWLVGVTQAMADMKSSTRPAVSGGGRLKSDMDARLLLVEYGCISNECSERRPVLRIAPVPVNTASSDGVW